MKTGLLTIDFLTLQETNVIQDSTNGPSERTVQVGGIETTCDTATVELLRDNLLGLADRVVPVQFQYKSSYNGFYRVSSITANTEKWYNGATVVVWQATLLRIGPDNTVDVESRLSNIVRANNFSLTGERWHAPAIGHRTYFTGSSTGSPMTRVADTGSITVYRGIPAGVNPRWGVSAADFPAGRVRFLNVGTELMSPRQLLPTTGWELNNGLVRIRPAATGTTTLLIAHYDGTTWREKAWDIRIGTDALVPTTHFTTVNLVRRNHEATAIRIHATQPSNGNRVIVDLLVRRGSRLVEGYAQRATSGDITVCLDVAESYTSGTGYVVSTTWDDGVRRAAGSAKTFTAATNLGVSVTSAVVMDFWIGAEVAGAVNGGAGDTNAGFELGTTFNWSLINGTGAALTTPTPPEGLWAGRVTATGGAPAQYNYGGLGFPGVASTQYLLTGWLMSPTGLSAGAAHIAAYYYSSVPTFISTTAVSAPALSAGVWTQVSGIITSPVGTATIGRQAALLGTPAAGAVLHTDSLRLRVAPDSGDLVAVLRDQYIGAMAEKMEVVRR